MELSAEAKELLDRAAKKKQDEWAKDRGFASMDEVSAHLKAQKDRADAYEVTGYRDDEESRKEYNWAGVWKGLQSGQLERYCSRELSLSRQMEDKLYAQGSVPDSAGGIIIPTVHAESLFVDFLRPKQVLPLLGVSEQTFTSTPVEIISLTRVPTADTVAENQAGTESDMEFAMLTMTPKTTQAMIRGSNRFWQMGAGANRMAQEHIGLSLALEYDRWGLRGTGASGEPIGVLSAPGVNRVDFTGTTEVVGGQRIPTSDFVRKVRQMRREIEDAEALDLGNTRWLQSTAANDIASMVHGEQVTLGSGATATMDMQRHLIQQGDVDRMLQYEIVRNTRALSSVPGAGAFAGRTLCEMILGSWSTITMGRWGGMVLRSTNEGEGTFKKRQTLLMAHTDVDFAHRYPESFRVASGLDSDLI